MVGPVTPEIGGDGGGTEISCPFSWWLMRMIPTTADAWAMLESAISGQMGCRPCSASAAGRSTALVVVDTGDDQRRVEEAEQGRAGWGKRIRHGLGGKADAVTNPAAERADEGGPRSPPAAGDEGTITR